MAQTLDELRSKLDKLHPVEINNQTAKIAIAFTLFNEGENMSYAHAEICAEALYNDWFSPPQDNHCNISRIHIQDAAYHMRSGKKIDAVKELRNGSNPKLSLRSAKDLVDILGKG